jgi:hypothetical protein
VDAKAGAFLRSGDLARLLSNDVCMRDDAAVCVCSLVRPQRGKVALSRRVVLVAQDHDIAFCATMSGGGAAAGVAETCLQRLCAGAGSS